MTLQDNGNLGLGNPNPQARLDVVGGGLRVRGGAITPDVGDGPTAGIQFPNDPGGGGGDEAYLRYSVVAGETTRLALGTGNDPDDYIALTQFGRERLTVRAGGVNIDGSDNVNAQVTLKSYSRTIANTWSGRITAGGDQNVVVAGEWAGAAVIGAHNTALNAWTDLNINPSGSNRVNINTSTPEPGSTLTVQGATTIRCGGNGGWDRLVIAPSNEWGDPNATHITLGTGGPAGVMLSNPHITWRDGKSSLRYGRVNRTAGNTYWDAGVRSDASFSFIPYDNGGDGSEKLKIQRSGEVLARNNVYVNTATNPLLFSAQWAGYTANGPQFAEISNDTNGYKCLMVVGNSSSGTRKVGVWDRLEVNGTMNVSSTATFGNWVNFGGNIGTRGYDANGGGIYPGGWGGGVHTWDIICEATIIYGNNCYKNSTLRVKENIRPLTGCLDIIDRLTPIKYDHREFSKSRDNFGFIAEEVRDVAPELVHAIDPGQPNFFAASLNQDSLTALALAGVQELARKVARLERQLAGADAPAAPAVRDAIEVLAEQTHARKDGVEEDYVAVRFTAEVPQLGERQTVRYLRLPPDFDRHEYLMGELKRWKHALTA